MTKKAAGNKHKASKSAKKVKVYAWEAINKRGELVKGEFHGASASLTKANLRTKGLIPKKIKKKSKSLFLRERKQRIKNADIGIFTRQMSTMLQSGIPLVQAFDIVAKSLNNISMRKLIMKIKTNVEEGDTFASALQKHPNHFSTLFCNLIATGEKSGNLEGMLDRVATYQEKFEAIKNKIKKAFIYPISVLVVATLVTAILMIKVVPQFEEMFKNFNAELPLPTQIAINISQFFQNYFVFLAIAIVVAVVAAYYAKKNIPTVAFLFDKIILRLPIVGSIIRNAIYARFARTLNITFSAGLPLVEALSSVAGATGNMIYYQTTLQIRDELATGKQLRQVMQETNLFPNMMIQMVGIGEEAGSLEDMLARVANYYEDQVDNAVDNISSLLEPIILVFLAVIVGGLVVAMYLPVFKLGNIV